MAGALDPMTGEEVFDAPPEKVYAALSDLSALLQHIPDVTASELVDAGTLKCTVRPGFSFIRGTMKLVIKLVEATPYERVGLQVNASGIGLTMDIESLLDISPVDNGARSKLNWKTQVVKRTGLISLVGASLIQGAAESTIKEGWQKLRAQLG